MYRYELTLVDKPHHGWTIEVYDQLHKMYLIPVWLGNISKASAESELQSLHRRLN